MRVFMWILSSSLLIAFVLAARKLFRKKLSPGAIYALWLIPMIRLMIPFGAWEIPAFGMAAETLQRPYETIETWTKPELSYEAKKTEEFSSPSKTGSGIEVTAAPETSAPVQKKTERLETLPYLLGAVWLVGSVFIGSYAFFQNLKLEKKIRRLQKAEEHGRLPVLVSEEIKVPCLAGCIRPKILMPRSIYENPELYSYALRHELCHYQQGDHWWTVIRIFLCIFCWWNPFVWIGAVCSGEDAEMSCDAKVLKGLDQEACRTYGRALLEILNDCGEEKTYFCAATSMGGSSRSIRERIVEIVRRTSTRRGVFVGIVLPLFVLLLLGSAVPGKRNMIKSISPDLNAEWIDLYALEAEYSMQKNIRSKMIYYEVYRYGELIRRQPFVFGNFEGVQDGIGKRHDRIRVWLTDSEGQQQLKYSDESMEASTVIMNPYYEETKGSGGTMFSGAKEILPGEDLLLIEFNQPKSEEAMGGELQDNYLTVRVRMIFSDLPEEELLAQQEARAYPKKEEILQILEDTRSETLEMAKAFIEENFGEAGSLSVKVNQPYRILDPGGEDLKAQILYYAADDRLFTSVWRQEVQYQRTDEGYEVESENLRKYDRIETLSAFMKAYPEGIEHTMMDYECNGLGEALNERAMNNRKNESYASLFSPETAAAELLNITKDQTQVEYRTKDLGETAEVTIVFKTYGQTEEEARVTMCRPYGKDGIWIPK